MIKARKAHGDKVILDDVTLAFIQVQKSGLLDQTVQVNHLC